jgi:hypothetical protein
MRARSVDLSQPNPPNQPRTLVPAAWRGVSVCTGVWAQRDFARVAARPVGGRRGARLRHSPSTARARSATMQVEGVVRIELQELRYRYEVKHGTVDASKTRLFRASKCRRRRRRATRQALTGKKAGRLRRASPTATGTEQNEPTSSLLAHRTRRALVPVATVPWCVGRCECRQETGCHRRNVVSAAPRSQVVLLPRYE